jgi:hypothetical protein
MGNLWIFFLYGVNNDANKVKEVRKCSGNILVAEYIYNAGGQRLIKKVYNNGIFVHMLITVNDLYELKINANGTEEVTTYYKANNELIAMKDNTGKVTYHHLSALSVDRQATGRQRSLRISKYGNKY